MVNYIISTISPNIEILKIEKSKNYKNSLCEYLRLKLSSSAKMTTIWVWTETSAEHDGVGTVYSAWYVNVVTWLKYLKYVYENSY